MTIQIVRPMQDFLLNENIDLRIFGERGDSYEANLTNMKV